MISQVHHQDMDQLNYNHDSQPTNEEDTHDSSNDQPSLSEVKSLLTLCFLTPRFGGKINAPFSLKKTSNFTFEFFL